MTDREMLDLAGKAAGFSEFVFINGRGAVYDPKEGIMQPYRAWDPLKDDGDALRLAVKVLNWPNGGRAFIDAVICLSAVGKLPVDPYAATRYAIVFAVVQAVINSKQPGV